MADKGLLMLPFDINKWSKICTCYRIIGQPLSLRDRELATVAVLTALGGREPQLRVHLGGAINVGLSIQEIEETILQTVPYAGFPTAINAMNLLRAVEQERGRNQDNP